MIKMESVKGAKEMYASLKGEGGIIPYEAKSEAFKQIVKSEKDLLALYENVLLNGSSGDLYTSAISKIKGENAQEKLQIAKEFYNEIKKDVETLTKKSHMIRTNELPRNKIYYNGNTVDKMLGKMSNFMSQSGFYNKLSAENKKELQEYLKIEEPKLDLADPDYEKKRDKYYEQQCEKISKSKLLPFIERITNDKEFENYMDLAARLANGQIDMKNLPKEFAEYKKNPTEGDVENFYKLVEFMADFNVKNEFEPEKIKKELAAEDPKSVNSADKSAELTLSDIKTIFLNPELYDKPGMMLKPEIVEGQIFAQPSDKKLAAEGMSYEQTISEIKAGLEQLRAGAKYKDLNPNIERYVKLLATKCPSAQFMPNLNLAEAKNCRLAKSNNASEMYEPVGEVEKFLVDGDRFTQDNVYKMINKISESKDLKAILFDENGKLKVRMDTLARVMNNEVDQRFLSDNERVCKIQLEDFYYKLKDEEKANYITSKEDYIKGNNSIMSINDMKILFECFVENIDKNPQFKMFNISEKDFEVVNGKEGKMLKQFGCTYDEFFNKLHEMYLAAYDQKAIFASDDKFIPYLRYIMGYNKDMTYAPSMGMNKEVNATENVYKAEEDVNTAILLPTTANDSTYAKYLLSLPSVRNAGPVQSYQEEKEEKMSLEEEYEKLMESDEELKKKLKNLKARLKKLQKESEGRDMSTEELNTKAYLQEKIRLIQRQRKTLEEQMSKLRARIVGNKMNKGDKELSEEQIAEIQKIINGDEKKDVDDKKLKREIDKTQEMLDKDEEQEEVSDKAMQEKDVEEEQSESDKEDKVEDKSEEQEEDDEYEYDEELELEIKEHLEQGKQEEVELKKLISMIKDVVDESEEIKEEVDKFEEVDEVAEEVVEDEVKEVKEDKKEEIKEEIKEEVKEEIKNEVKDEVEELEEIVDEDSDEFVEEVKKTNIQENAKTQKVEADNVVLEEIDDEEVELEEIDNEEVELEEIDNEEVELEEIVDNKEVKNTVKVVDDKSEKEAEELGLAMVKQYKAS